MRLKIRVSMTVVLSLLAGSAGAQFEYTPPGAPQTKPESPRDVLERRVAAAPYRLGPVHVAPWATLRDVSYVRTLFVTGTRPPSDLTATAGAGFRAYLRNGSKATWTLEVLPEYVYWARQSERRRINGRYQLGYHAFFNRLTVEAAAGREQRLRILTPELPELVDSRSDRAELTAELEVSPSFFAFGSASTTDQRHLIDGVADPRLQALRGLDRRERIAQAGLRWAPRRELWVALGAQGERTDFERSAVPRSNSGTSPLLRLHYRGRLLGFDAEVLERSLSARQGSEFVPYDRPTGSAALQLGTTGRRASGTLYLNRSLIYALTSGYAYLQDDRVGVSFQAPLGHRIRGHAFVETGQDDYTPFSPAAPRRSDDVTSYGVGLDLDLVRGATFGFQALRSRFEANVPGGDRTYSSAGITLNLFGGNGGG